MGHDTGINYLSLILISSLISLILSLSTISVLLPSVSLSPAVSLFLSLL
jgi:hypothetical protein